MKIKADSLAGTINEYLAEYGDVVIETLEDAVSNVAKESVNDLKQGGPYKTRNKAKYTGAWKSKTEKSRTGASATVYNAKSPGLAHLLEFGHATKNGGRTKAYPHVEPVDDKTEKRILSYLENKL